MIKSSGPFGLSSFSGRRAGLGRWAYLGLRACPSRWNCPTDNNIF